MTKHQLCRNCGARVAGNYCCVCGQRSTTARLDMRVFAESFVATFIGDEAYGVRGIHMRMGAVRTWLAIVLRPCRSVSEYIEGRRRKYFNPVAILLLLSTVYGVVFALVGKTFIPSVQEGEGMLAWLFHSYYDYARLHPAANELVTLPVYALALKTVFFRKADLRYVEYLFIGIFLSIFKVTLMIALLPVETLVSWYAPFWMNILPMFVYAAFVFRRLFTLTRKGAILRTLAANMLHYAYLLVAICGLGAATLMTYYYMAPEQFRKEFGIETEQASERPRATFRIVLSNFLDAIEEDGTQEHDAEPPSNGNATQPDASGAQ